jgi:malate dehydrogenase (quinone)
MVGAGITNLSLVKYLIGELLAGRTKKQESLQKFASTAKRDDWYLATAGQRVQIMKRDANGKPTIRFGNEVVASADGSIGGLVGASPRASTAVPSMLDVLAKCFPERLPTWQPKLKQMVPSYGTQLSSDEATAAKTLARTAKALELTS